MLVKGGVPWEEARGWSANRRFAAMVLMGQMEGCEFDWTRGEWKKPQANGSS